MGCVYSRTDFENTNPRVFQVWNVDEDGRNVKPGKIEVTDSQLILYQRGDVTVRWPLRSLRRYGFDAELFSFECGRRCPTGPGVYAFRCRRAEALFNILQECVQNSGGGTGNISTSAIDDQISLSTNGLNSGGVLVSSNGVSVNSMVQDNRQPAVDSSGYLEPITVNHSNQCPLGPGARSNSGTTASSPGGGFVCIHSSVKEGMTVEWSAGGVHQSPSGCCLCRKGSAPHYVNKDAAEQTSSKFPGNMCLMHQYVNASVVSSDPSRRCCCSSTRCTNQTQNTYMNSSLVSTLGLSPGHLPCASGSCAMNCMNCVDINTNYAKLDDLLKQEQSAKRQKEQHYYVNVKPDASSGSGAKCIKCLSGRSTPTDCPHKDGKLTSPSKSQHSHFYANLGSPSSVVISDTSKELARSVSQVNYAVLDLEKSDANTAVTGSPVSGANGTLGNSLPTSPLRTPEGYAQIDFDKTVALSNSAIPCPSYDDSIRKTRHNAVIPSSSVPS